MNEEPPAGSVPPALHNYPAPPAYTPPKEEHDHSGLKSVISTVLLFLLAPIIAISITAFCFQSYQVDGQSMETTLQNNDRLIVNKFPRTWAKITKREYIPHRGDIIIFDKQGLFDANGNQEKQLIKRVIGLPGDRVVIKDSTVFVYNKDHPNGFDPDKQGSYTISQPTTPGESSSNGVTVAPGQVFVMGDNRTNSADSRFFGPIDANAIVGKLQLRVLPLSKAENF